MQVYDPARDCEAQAGAAGFPGAGLIGAVKAFEDVREVFAADADSTVVNFDSRIS
jgi:hypothetical protein